MVSALADTGAQSNLWGWKSFQDAGLSKNDLLPVSITIRAANIIPINILGAFRATVSEISQKNKIVRYNNVIYVSNSVTGFFSRMNLEYGSQLLHLHS